MSEQKKRWISPAPKQCDLCGVTIGFTFVDGNTLFGSWANMCPDCHRTYGKGLGTGRGQRYELINGEWLKVAG